MWNHGLSAEATKWLLARMNAVRNNENADHIVASHLLGTDRISVAEASAANQQLSTHNARDCDGDWSAVASLTRHFVDDAAVLNHCTWQRRGISWQALTA